MGFNLTFKGLISYHDGYLQHMYYGIVKILGLQTAIIKCDVRRICNLVNKANLVHNGFLVHLFLACLSIYTCFGRLCVHHQEKQLCFCDTWYLLFCVDGCLVRPDSHPHRLINILRINCAPSRLYLQYYKGM
jgi:hypothetical protein